MPRRAANIETFIRSSVADYESLIEALYGHRPRIERLMVTEKRTDNKRNWTGVAVCNVSWRVTFMGQVRGFEYIDRSVKWMAGLAGGAA